ALLRAPHRGLVLKAAEVEEVELAAVIAVGVWLAGGERVLEAEKIEEITVTALIAHCVAAGAVEHVGPEPVAPPAIAKRGAIDQERLGVRRGNGRGDVVSVEQCAGIRAHGFHDEDLAGGERDARVGHVDEDRSWRLSSAVNERL